MITSQPTNESVVSAWFAENKAVWCHRLSSIITVVGCRQNRSQSVFDCRCIGCSGLDNQEINETLKYAPMQPLNILLPEKIETEIIQVSHKQLISDSDMDDLLADLFEEELEEDDEHRLGAVYLDEPCDKSLPVLVYTGRCVRCNGSMLHDTEHQFDMKDNEVYRCHVCGWRTSPQYEHNRAIFAKTGGI